MNEILIWFFLGAIQGITEWLPLSSSAVITFLFVNFLGQLNIELIIKEALFLHMGTFFAALVYFRNEVIYLVKSVFRYKHSSENTKKVINFLIISTIISGVLGIILLNILTNYGVELFSTGKAINVLIGTSLLITALLKFGVRSDGGKSYKKLKIIDGIFLGIAQGLSVIPGISRSGITVSSLLLRKFDDTVSLKLSFLMSLPIVLIGNIFLNFDKLNFTVNSIYSLTSSFIFGILTISFLINLSKRMNLGWFTLIFGLLVIAGVFF